MRISVDAPAGMHPLDVAQAYVGSHLLLKATHQAPPERALRKHPRLRKMADKASQRYQASVKAMVSEIQSYIDTQSVTRKATAVSPFADPEQMAAIFAIVRRHHAHVVVETLGPEFVPPDVLEDLKDRGLVPRNLSDAHGLQVITEAAHYGRTAAHMPPPIPAHLRKPDVAEGATTAPSPRPRPSPPPVPPPRKPAGGSAAPPPPPPAYTPPPPPPPPVDPPGGLPDLTRSERLALEYANNRAGQYITGLTDRVAKEIHGLTVAEGEVLRSRYRDGVTAAIANREAWGSVKSKIGHATGEWSRDLDRVVATEMHEAYQQGKAGELMELHGETANVFKQPSGDACPDCLRLHIDRATGNPIVFKLADLASNGTNVGRKRAEWQPVIGTIHPWCSCELTHMPAGWAFDEDGSMVPEGLLRSDVGIGTLRKGDKLLMSAPEKGCFIDIKDPRMSAAVQSVVDAGPAWLFDRDIGVTVITNDYPRESQNHLACGDLAYQVGNEIRLSYTLPLRSVRRVVRHELAHGLNVYLKAKLGSVPAVLEWHKRLFAIGKKEGHVSAYASTSPIECAAEVTANYLWNRVDLGLEYPMQYRFAHEAYGDLVRSEGLMKARKLHRRRMFAGMRVSVETQTGAHRHWHDPHSGESGSTAMLYDYGYIRGTLGTDGDHVDVYVGPNAEATHAYVITQMKKPPKPARWWTAIDEQKVMLGFDSEASAKGAYLRHYNDPRFFGTMTAMPIETFRAKVMDKKNHGDLIKATS